MVIFLFLLLFVVGVGALFFFWNRFHRFRFVQEIAREHKKRSWLVAFLPVSLLILLFFIKTVMATIISLHLLAFWIFCDFGAWLIKKFRSMKFAKSEKEVQTEDFAERVQNQSSAVETKKSRVRKSDFAENSPVSEKNKESSNGIYVPGILAIFITAVYLCIGWYYGHHVFEMHYSLETEKNLGRERLRIVQISDSHIGSTSIPVSLTGRYLFGRHASQSMV